MSHPERSQRQADELQRLKAVKERLEGKSPDELMSNLEGLRGRLDNIDRNLVRKVLKNRREIVDEIAVIKGILGMPDVQPERREVVLNQREQWGREIGLRDGSTKSVMSTVHDESVEDQKYVRKMLWTSETE